MTNVTELPLSRYALFHSNDLDEAREEVAKIFCPHRLTTVRATRLDACHHSVDLGGFSLNYVRYGADVIIEPGELGTFFLLQIPLSGHAHIRSGQQELDTSPRQASLLSPSLGVSMRWSEGCAKLLAQIPRAAVERTLQAMLGRSLRGSIEFDAALNLDVGAGRRIGQMVHLLRDDVDATDTMILRSSAGPHMRETLIMALLNALPHNYADMLRAPAPGIAPRHVRQAEEYMRAKAAEHVTVSDIAAAVGVSIRSLQEGFRHFRDLTPLESLRNLRLEGARAALLGATPGESVTSVALAWGFAHLSRFAISYQARYGELPSETLRRSLDKS
jgi:AraC-like DNA-binding protein